MEIQEIKFEEFPTTNPDGTGWLVQRTLRGFLGVPHVYVTNDSSDFILNKKIEAFWEEDRYHHPPYTHRKFRQHTYKEGME